MLSLLLHPGSEYFPHFVRMKHEGKLRCEDDLDLHSEGVAHRQGSRVRSTWSTRSVLTRTEWRVTTKGSSYREGCRGFLRTQCVTSQTRKWQVRRVTSAKRTSATSIWPKNGMRSSSCCVVTYSWTWDGTESLSSKQVRTEKVSAKWHGIKKCMTSWTRKQHTHTPGGRSRSSSRCSFGTRTWQVWERRDAWKWPVSIHDKRRARTGAERRRQRTQARWKCDVRRTVSATNCPWWGKQSVRHHTASSMSRGRLQRKLSLSWRRQELKKSCSLTCDRHNFRPTIRSILSRWKPEGTRRGKVHERKVHARWVWDHMFLRQRNLDTSLLASFLVNVNLTMIFIDILDCRHHFKVHATSSSAWQLVMVIGKRHEMHRAWRLHGISVPHEAHTPPGTWQFNCSNEVPSCRPMIFAEASVHGLALCLWVHPTDHCQKDTNAAVPTTVFLREATQGKSFPTQCETHCVLCRAAHDAEVPNESDSFHHENVIAYGLTHSSRCSHSHWLPRFLKQSFVVVVFCQLSLTFECGLKVAIKNIWTWRIDGAKTADHKR